MLWRIDGSMRKLTVKPGRENAAIRGRLESPRLLAEALAVSDSQALNTPCLPRAVRR